MYLLEHEHTLRNFNKDTIKISELNGNGYKSHTCGYVTPKGTVFSCEPYGHLTMLKDMCYGTYKELFENFQDYCYKKGINIIKNNMSVYETFFMIECGWAKIAAYRIDQHNCYPEDAKYKWMLERVYDLTPEQIEKIFPK